MGFLLRILIVIFGIFIFLAGLALQQCGMATKQDQTVGMIMMAFAALTIGGIIFVTIKNRD